MKKDGIIISGCGKKMSRFDLALRLTSMGFYIGGCIILGVFGGLWLDRKWDTGPIFAIIGLILGIILSFLIVYRLLKPLINNREKKGNK